MGFAKTWRKVRSVVEAVLTKVPSWATLTPQFVKTHVIKTSNDTFHVVMTLACVMVSFSDGAPVTMFPGHFNCVAVLVESAQTLTSRMVNLLRNAATEINRHVRDSVQGETR